LIRRLSTPNLLRIEHILDKIELIEGDLTDQSPINNALKESTPDEVYNLVAQSFVATSWNQPVLTGDVTGLGAVRILEGVRHVCPDARVYQVLPSYTPTGLASTTGNAMVCTHPTGYCSTTNHRGAE
jgi:GDPmannose 4,6-dehydratase